jgi:hypothetical protein
MQNANASAAGFSDKINDPAFEKYISSSNQWSFFFALGLALVAVVGFFIYGETSSEMDNPQALFIGMGIGGMFMFIAIIQIIGRKRGKTWDGQVVNKTIEDQRRKRYQTDHIDRDGRRTESYVWEDYKLYTVHLRSDQGKAHQITAEDDDTVYNYYQIGDRIRHHGKLHTYEKYDKSADSIIFCNACATRCSMQDDYCPRCKCPLLK